MPLAWPRTAARGGDCARAGSLHNDVIQKRVAFLLGKATGVFSDFVPSLSWYKSHAYIIQNSHLNNALEMKRGRNKNRFVFRTDE